MIEPGKEEKCQGSSGPCSNTGKRRIQNTAYQNDESNYRTLCPECQKAEDKHWDEMWTNYYRSVI